MTGFDNFSSQLWEEAKRFYEKALLAKDAEQAAYLHSAVLIGMSALEAYINGICEELLLSRGIPLQEQSLLKEREIAFDSGEFFLSDKLKIYRLTDRIEFLFFKFGGIKLNGRTHSWYGDLQLSIKLRNSLVHPKEEVRISESNTKLLLLSINSCLEHVSKCVYNKPFPFIALELQSKLTF